MDTSTTVTSDDLKTDLKEDREDKKDKVIVFFIMYICIATVYA